MRPFEGIKVLDLTHVLAGPFATYQLAVLGADVIKIEDPLEPDQSRGMGGDKQLNRAGLGTHFLTQASNKRSMTLNLRTSEAREVLKRMVRDVDVFVENYRPGAFEAMGLGYDDLSAINPRLIYCSISAFGQNGPRREQTAYDIVIQAASGLMAITGTPEVSPIKVGASVVDYATGTMGAFALASALFQRERTGKGQWIDLAMLDAALMVMGSTVTAHLRSGVDPKPAGNKTRFATNTLYETREGLIVIGASNLRQQRRVWEALGHPEMIKEDQEARDGDSAQEAALMRDIMMQKTAAEWEDFFQSRHIPASRVRTLGEAVKDPQLAERSVFGTHPAGDGFDRELKVPVSAFRLAHGGPSLDSPPARLGGDTTAILTDLGFTDTEITALRSKGAL